MICSRRIQKIEDTDACANEIPISSIGTCSRWHPFSIDRFGNVFKCYAYLHWRTGVCVGGGGGLGLIFNSIQAHPYTCRQVEISFLGMPQIAHFEVEKLKSSLAWEGGTPPPPPPKPFLRSVATLPRAWSLHSLANIAPPNVLAHYATAYLPNKGFSWQPESLPDIATSNVCKLESKHWGSFMKSRLMK